MSRAFVVPFAGAHSGNVLRPLRPVAWVGRLARTVDPDGQASIWYERPGATVTSDRGAVKMPTVRPRTAECRPPEPAATAGSGAGDGSHRVEPDHDRRPGVERQLVADVAGAEELAEERSLARRQPDVDPAAISQIDRRHVVLRAVDPEPAT